MIENSKCECGHNNPVGTILCESCGKPLDEETKGKETIVQEMRYEGKARRSQTFQSSPFDMVWNFFSSVKVAIILIIITLIAASIGTIFPQEKFVPSSDPAAYYEKQYGLWGKWFHILGFSDMYNSWWFFTMVSLIGISLVVCSLDRVIPLYKALKNQQVRKSVDFLKRQRITAETTLTAAEADEKLAKLEQALQSKRYQVKREGNALLAEKGRISRWGPYINHIGLIIFLFGVLLRYVPGWYLDETMWVREGEVKKVPELPYYVKNEGFDITFYDQKNVPKSKQDAGPIAQKYETRAVLYEKDWDTGKLKPVAKGSILVNHPLAYKDLRLVQADFRIGLLDALDLKLVDKESGKALGKFTVDLYDLKPNQVFRVKDKEVVLLDYYPDFALENNRPITKSPDPNKPAFVFEVREKGQAKGERSWVISGQNLDELTKENRYAIDLAGMKMVDSTGLMVRVDKSLNVILFGGVICMIGLVMGFYWHHRRVWALVDDGRLYIGAHTNKNWYSLERELKLTGEFDTLQVKRN